MIKKSACITAKRLVWISRLTPADFLSIGFGAVANFFPAAGSFLFGAVSTFPRATILAFFGWAKVFCAKATEEKINKAATENKITKNCLMIGSPPRFDWTIQTFLPSADSSIFLASNIGRN